jgi:hypothetical protein
VGVPVEAVRPHLAAGKPSAARQGFLSQRVPVAGTSLPQKMLGGDATVPVKCMQDKAARPPIPIRRGTAVQFNWKLS